MTATPLNRYVAGSLGSELAWSKSCPDFCPQNRLWGSRRCRRIGFPFIEAGWFTQTGHYFGYQNAAISEGEALAAVVRSLSETRAETGSREILLPSMRVSSSRAEPSRPANGAPHERGEYGGSDPPFLAASAAQRGGVTASR